MPQPQPPPGTHAGAESELHQLPVPPARPARRRLRDMVFNALPGFLAGAHLSGLMFFLNPEIPFAWMAMLTVAAKLGSVFGLITAIVLSYFTWSRPGLAGRMLPWAITVVLTLAAVADWTHASMLGFFLPPGINVRLIKAAIGLTVGALACFYTTLLHSASERSYGRRSIALYLILCGLSIYLLGERREAFNTRVTAAPLPSVVESSAGFSLVLVGIEGATLDAILPLAEQGHLPFFAQLIETGSYARLSSLSPPVREPLWTSLATGKLPYRHGVLGKYIWSARSFGSSTPLRLLPGGPLLSDRRIPGLERQLLKTDMRKTRALWEVLAQLGLPAGLVGWPASYPITDPFAFTFTEPFFEGDFSAAAALPPELAERGVLFQVGTEEIDPAVTEVFGAEVPIEVLTALSEDLWRESLTLFLLDQRQDLRTLFLLLPGLGEISMRYFHGFSRFQLEGMHDSPYQEAAQLVRAYYQHLDSFLAQLWQRRSGAQVFALVSSFGTEAPRGWRRVWMATTGRPLEGAVHPTPDGVLFLLGDGIKPGNFLNEAGLLDVLPTLLYGLGLPISRDLDGEVLISTFENAFLARTPLTFVPSYENLEPAPAATAAATTTRP